MTTYRNTIFANNEIYHVYNRGVEQRTVFTNIREFQRAMSTISWYRFSKISFSLSKFFNLSFDDREEYMKNLQASSSKLINIIAYCLMPNHFHFVLQQNENKGISNFISNFTNSYTKYFNKKNKRVGPLFQGIFKAVRVESNEQLIHLWTGTP